MTIVEKIFAKAAKGGFQVWKQQPTLAVQLSRLSGKNTLYFTWISATIHSAEFAQAFWKDNEWEWHLREMAVIPIEERIKYLLKFL